MNEFERDIVATELRNLEGIRQPAAFFKLKRTNPGIRGEYQYHNLIRGIYKPKGCSVALSIIQTLGGPYADNFVDEGNGRWHMDYVQQGRGARWWDNVSLQRCIDSIPVVVIVQVSGKLGVEGSQYKILGLGKVQNYDEQTGVFKLRRWEGEPDLSWKVNATEQDVALAEKEIAKDLKKPFSPFSENRRKSIVTRVAREEGFRRKILDLYRHECAVCGSRWSIGDSHEADGAHIIPKGSGGSDDLRNGIALCKFHHWAFDKGGFSMADDRTILISPRIREFSSDPERIMQFEGRKVASPRNERAIPARLALKWHRENILKL